MDLNTIEIIFMVSFIMTYLLTSLHQQYHKMDIGYVHIIKRIVIRKLQTTRKHEKNTGNIRMKTFL